MTQQWYRRSCHARRQAGVEMQSGFLSRSVDRLVANARAIRGAPEAILLVVIVGIGISGFGFLHYRERLSDLNGRLASQDTLLTEYRTKLTEAETQVMKLTSALAGAEKRLKAAKDKPVLVENPSRDCSQLVRRQQSDRASSRPENRLRSEKGDIRRSQLWIHASNQ